MSQSETSAKYSVLQLWKKLTFVSILICLTGCPTPPKPQAKLTPLAFSPSAPTPAPPQSIPVPAVQGGNASLFSTDNTERHRANGPWIWLDSWTRDHQFGPLSESTNTTHQTFALTGAPGSLSIVVGSRLATWNKLILGLGFEPRLIHGRPAIHQLDLTKNLQPLLQPVLRLPSNRRVIVIDPGHGGKNTGARSVVGSLLEKDLTLDWARRTQTLLAAQGWTVWLTRTGDKDVSSAERIAFADSVQADLFLSLHFNSAGRTTAGPPDGGLETYCLTPTGMPSNLTRNYEDDPKRVFPNNSFDDSNLLLAASLHDSMVRFVGRKDRGIRRARFMTVLQGQQRPAALLEGGFLTDTAEARLIASNDYRQKLAQSIAFALR